MGVNFGKRAGSAQMSAARRERASVEVELESAFESEPVEIEDVTSVVATPVSDREVAASPAQARSRDAPAPVSAVQERLEAMAAMSKPAQRSTDRQR